MNFSAKTKNVSSCKIPRFVTLVLFVALLLVITCIMAIAANSNVKYDEYAPVEITQKLDKAVLQDTYVTLQFEELDADGNAYTNAKTYRETFKFEKDSKEVTKKVMLGVYKNYKITAVGNEQFSNWRYTQDSVEFNNPTTSGGNDVWSATDNKLPATIKIGTVDKPSKDRKITLSATLSNEKWLQDTVNVTNTIDFSNYYHVTFNSNGHGNNVSDINVEKGEAIASVKDDEAIKTETGDVEGLTLEGWYTDAKCSTKFELTTAVTADLVLYANWTPKADTITKAYWIAPAYKTTTGNVAAKVNQTNSNFVSEITNVKKSEKEIQADVAVLNDAEHVTYTAEKYNQVYDEYESFMKNDDYHLYCKYNASTGTGKDDYVEFRILQVGEHSADGEGDGTALTFEATNALPLGSVPNTYHDNEGGWKSSELYSDMQSGGEIYKLFSSELQSNVMSVNKKSMGGGGTGTGMGASTELTGSAYSKFWVTSTSEIRGLQLDGYKGEGDQYAYYKNIGLDATYQTGSTTVLASTPAFLSKSYTRSGANPTNARIAAAGTGSGNHHGYIALRGPSAYNSTGWQWQAANSTAGTQYTEFTHGGTNYLNGVVPAFSFGKNTITFDMQGQGEQIAQQTWNFGNFNVDTTKTTPAASSYDATSLTFGGWFDNAACSGTAIDLSTKTFTSSTTLYACWKATDTLKTKYWISPSYKYIAEGQNVAAASNAVASGGNYVDETTGIIKTNTQIQEDVAKIRKGSEATKAYYKKIMNKDKYHLYTRIATSGNLNDFVEFRILAVGEHDGGEALTFQATHLMPSAYTMNGSDTNANGWSGSALRTKMQSGGAVFVLFNAGFTNDIVKVTKKSTAGSGSANLNSSNDQFWLISVGEMTTSALNGFVLTEGSIYDFYKVRNISTANANPAMVFTTRAGGTPAGSYSAGTYPRAFNRSAMVNDGKYSAACYNSRFSTTVTDTGSLVGIGGNGGGFAFGCIPCFAFGGTSYKVSFDMQGHGTQVKAQYVLSGSTATAPTDDEYGTQAGLKLDGWYTDAKCTAANKVNFATYKPTADTTLYANWVPDTDANKYWIAPAYKMTTGNTAATAYQTNANYVSEQWNVKKSSAEIQSDIKVLKIGNVASNPTYATVKAEYEGFMNSDNYHLYTKIGTGTTKDDYLECRILQVGEHDGDDSVLTFQSIATLSSTGYARNPASTTTGGWAKSTFRTLIGGTILDSMSGIKDDIWEVTKKTSGGSASTAIGTTQEKLWLTSVSEMTTTVGNCSPNEGSIYSYWQSKGIVARQSGATNTNNAYAVIGMGKTRSGSLSGGTDWSWLRSDSLTNTISGAFVVGTSSDPYLCADLQSGQRNNQAAKLGINPTFCLGGYLVQYDSQGGSDVDSQLLNSKTTATCPSNPTREGYIFKGWYKEAACTNAWDFSTDLVSGDMTLYAKWENAKDSYWLNVANAENPEEGILKSRDEIQNDVAKISAGDAQTIAEYTEYMNGTAGTAESEVHLYTKVGSGTTANDYAEFRIIAVGEHETGDGTAITWQMTHVLPNAYSVNSSSVGAWKDTSLSASLKNNSLTDTLPTSITDDAKELTKSEVKSKLWVLSADEIYGTSASGSGICASEGTQYDYYENTQSVTKSDSTYECLAYRTRDGNLPTGQSTNYDKYHGDGKDSTNEKYVSWWTRDACAINPDDWCRVYNDGRLDHETTSTKRGVAVAFSMAQRVVMNTQNHGSSTFTLPIDADGKVTSTSALNGTSKGLMIEGWYKNTMCTGDKVADATATSSALGTTRTLYANWVPDSTTNGNLSYWISPSYKITTGNTSDSANIDNTNSDSNTSGTYVKEEWNVKKSSSEIKADITRMKQELADGKTTATEGSTLKEYADMMTKDNYHLYTKWNGSTTDYAGANDKNAYIEARVLQVGEHDNDGSTLTFQPTHTLPYCLPMSTASSNVGGWTSASIRTSLSSGGAVWTLLNNAFTSDLLQVEKKTTAGSASTAIAATNDKLWLLSYSEIKGATNTYQTVMEGSQYSFYSTKGMAANGNECIRFGSRAGNAPSNEAGGNRRSWHLRSPETTNSTYWAMVFERQLGENGNWSGTSKSGIVPCFAF